jgi:uncharacterized membrane protein
MKGSERVPELSHPWLHGVAALLSLGGLADSIYLTVTHLTGENVTCVASSGCSEVLRSAYATVGKIPLGAFGALGYFAAFSLATLAAFGYARARTLLTVVIAGMLATALWLLYVQAFVLHAFCDFCLLSAGFTFSLAALVAAGYLADRKHPIAVERAPLPES